MHKYKNNPSCVWSRSKRIHFGRLLRSDLPVTQWVDSLVECTSLLNKYSWRLNVIYNVVIDNISFFLACAACICGRAWSCVVYVCNSFIILLLILHFFLFWTILLSVCRVNKVIWRFLCVVVQTRRVTQCVTLKLKTRFKS